MENVYDVVIVGGGPGGCAAGLYCARAGRSVLLLERQAPGGQMAATGQIENYPGYPEGIDGFALGQKMAEGVTRSGGEIRYGEIKAVDLSVQPKRLETSAGPLYARTVILATGAYPRTLGLPEEESLRGRGVGYCAVCDGGFYRGKTVVVVGGGNSALSDAIYLSKLCRKVYIVHRRGEFTAARVYQRALDAAGVEVVWNHRVTAIRHGNTVTGVEVTDVLTGEKRELSCEGVFVAIGREPDTALFRGQVSLDERGYIAADETTRTNIPGVFAVGDVRSKPMRQIVTAVADGAVASHYVEKYLLEQE